VAVFNASYRCILYIMPLDTPLATPVAQVDGIKSRALLGNEVLVASGVDMWDEAAAGIGEVIVISPSPSSFMVQPYL
jgi:hypothetical protein